MKREKAVEVTWVDAWLENELSDEDIKRLERPQTPCTLVGYLVFDDGDTIGVAAEKVVSREGEISWRAVTFIPRSLITKMKGI